MTVFVSAISMLVASQSASAPRELHGVVPYDVVHLLKTEKQVEGKKSIQLVRYGYEYHFANEANRKEFLKQPTKYEVQLGGACGRMGYMTGHGAPERYAIYNGKLYFFASDGCRKSFLAKPHESLEKEDTPFESNASGLASMEKALRWMGGRNSVSALAGYLWKFSEIVPSGNQTYQHEYVLENSFGKTWQVKDRWNESLWTSFTSASDSYIKSSNGEYRDMHPEEQAALRRLCNRDLLSIMHAFASGKANAKFLKSESGVDTVAVFHDRTRNVVEVDSLSGRILATEFVGKTPSSYIGRTRYDFTAWGFLNGVKVPTAWTATHNGKLRKNLSRSGLVYEVQL